MGHDTFTGVNSVRGSEFADTLTSSNNTYEDEDSRAVAAMTLSTVAVGSIGQVTSMKTTLLQ